MINLVNKTKKTVLKEDTVLETTIFAMGKKYNKFVTKKNSDKIQQKCGNSIVGKIKKMIIWFESNDFGKKNKFYQPKLHAKIKINDKYGEYYYRYQQKLNKTPQTVQKRKLNKLNILTNIIKERNKKNTVMAWQAQENVDGNKIVLTQLGYSKDPADTVIYLLHPPAKSRKVLLKQAQESFEQIKKYKGQRLSEEKTDEIYQKVGEIHWYLAQAMPFRRGSASVADAFTKSIFEALNIQTRPWKTACSPDLEAFDMTMEEYSQKYKTFFSQEGKKNFMSFVTPSKNTNCFGDLK